MNGPLIHLNLKLIEILKDQTQKLKVQGRNTRIRCNMSKGNNNDSRAMTFFCLGVGRQVYLFKANNIGARIRCMLKVNNEKNRAMSMTSS